MDPERDGDVELHKGGYWYWGVSLCAGIGSSGGLEGSDGVVSGSGGGVGGGDGNSDRGRGVGGS